MNQVETRALEYLQQLQLRMNDAAAELRLTHVLEIWQKANRKSYWPTSMFSINQKILERSVAYIYLRDLGKSLADSSTQQRVQDSTRQWVEQMSIGTGKEVTLHRVLQWARDNGIERSLVWFIEKLLKMEANLPNTIDVNHALRKNIKLTIGVLLHQLDQVPVNESASERVNNLERALTIGYSYGATYPLIDDLLDSNTFDEAEAHQLAKIIRQTLNSGTVPALDTWDLPQTPFNRYVHAELSEAFHTIESSHAPQAVQRWREIGLQFFEAQEQDRNRRLDDATITNEQLYVPIIIKSAYSRMLARQLLSDLDEQRFEQHMWQFGLFNQLSDDMHDFDEDLAQGRVTPFTYYHLHHQSRPDLIHPMHLYWATLHHLMEVTYDNDLETKHILIARVINGQRRLRRKGRSHGIKLSDLLFVFVHPNASMKEAIERAIFRTNEVTFLDKQIRDGITQWIGGMRRNYATFRSTVESIRIQLNEQLAIVPDEEDELLQARIVEAANYSLTVAGKRFRPIMAWIVAVNYFQLDPQKLMPLFRSLEYMHTASLIYDDLPAQDDATLRRGQPVLHKKFTVAEAELTALYLTQRALAEQASLKQHWHSDKVIELMAYTSETTMKLTKGQWIDLQAKGQKQTFRQLQRLAHYKTGLAFEASLITPALLAGATEKEISLLAEIAEDLGLLFQMKDDILDREGDAQQLGKQTGTDGAQGRSTFVTELGLDEAKVQLWRTYDEALLRLNRLPRHAPMMGQLLFAMIHREK